MIGERAALIRGETILTEAGLRERIAATDPGVDRPGRVVAIRDPDGIDALVAALAARGAGGVPLIGDDRWNATYWEELRRRVRVAAAMPGMAWATFTSGSAGTPRAIVRSEASWSASFPAVGRLIGLTGEDVLYLPAPLVSSMTTFSVAHARAVGAAVLLPRTHTVSAVDLERATVLHGSPYALRDIVTLVEAGAAHRLRVALVGGARLDAGLRARAEAAGIRVVGYYGAAELSFVAVDPDGQGLRPFDGVEIRVDEGVLWARSAYFAGGYLGGTDGPFRRGGDGWATVGDLAGLGDQTNWADQADQADQADHPKPTDRAYQTNQTDPTDPTNQTDPTDQADQAGSGRLRLLGRGDGAILTAAATVIPEDVEAALLGIDGIADAVVFALPHAGAGSLVAAVVEPAPGRRPPSVGHLRTRAGTLLTATHRPRRWFWAERLPRTPAGKPARERIRRDAIEGRLTPLA